MGYGIGIARGDGDSIADRNVNSKESVSAYERTVTMGARHDR